AVGAHRPGRRGEARAGRARRQWRRPQRILAGPAEPGRSLLRIDRTPGRAADGGGGMSLTLHKVLSRDTPPARASALSASLTLAWRAVLKIKHVPFQLFDVTVF